MNVGWLPFCSYETYDTAMSISLYENSDCSYERHIHASHFSIGSLACLARSYDTIKQQGRWIIAMLKMQGLIWIGRLTTRLAWLATSLPRSTMSRQAIPGPCTHLDEVLCRQTQRNKYTYYPRLIAWLKIEAAPVCDPR